MKWLIPTLTLLAVLGLPGVAMSAYQVSFGFETSWSGDYAPGWVNSDYRHGPPPIGTMMQQTGVAHSGSYGMKLTADSVPVASMFWAGVSVDSVLSGSMAKKYNPWISAWYYDPGAAQGTGSGQIFSVPSWVNPYIPPGEDWTDIQFGARRNVFDNYYFVAAGEASPGWVDTGIGRDPGWVNFKMQLLDLDGKVHFYLDGVEVGTSYRSDYVDLGEEIGLYTMFLPPLSGWTEKPYTIWDDFSYGSDAPEPASLVIWGLLATAGVVLAWRRRAA